MINQIDNPPLTHVNHIDGNTPCHISKEKHKSDIWLSMILMNITNIDNYGKLTGTSGSFCWEYLWDIPKLDEFDNDLKIGSHKSYSGALLWTYHR